MKTLLTIFTLVFTVMFSSTSFSGWTKFGHGGGTTYYMDLERIRKQGGYVYYWVLHDYLKPTKQGHLSIKSYNQGDCKVMRYKYLSAVFHNQPMGRDTGKTIKPPDQWEYASPNTVEEFFLEKACSR